MKLPLFLSGGAWCVAFLLAGGSLSAQTMVAIPPAEDVLDLPTYEVAASREGDYRNPQSVTATRIVADIKDIPLTVTAIGEEFLRDTGTQDFQDAFRYTANIAVTDPDSQRKATAPIKIRGFNSSYTLRNGFTKYYQQNLDGVDRVEVVRGPVSTFYGRVNDPGGVINYITKRPLFEWRHAVKAQYGSWDFYKAWVDSTGPILKDHLAFRVVSTYQNSGSWKDYVTNERSYFLGTLHFRPTSRVDLIVDYEYNKLNSNGGINTGLVQNEDYTSAYDTWQGVAARDEWYKQIGSKNTGTASSGYFWYNMDITTRYPRVYPKALFGSDRTAPWLKDDYVRDFEDQDPRTGASQEPILLRDANWGSYAGASFTPSRVNSAAEMRKYRYGWRMVEYMESLGLFRDGKFVRDDTVIPPAGQPTATGDYPPALTGNVFPLGYEFNPNGPGSWTFDESHVASAELRWRVLDRVLLRLGTNYYENYTRALQQYNSDTDMDGYTLEPRQGITSAGLAQGAGFTNFYNKYWTHQADLTWDFDIGPTSHTILATVEYRHDEFTSYNAHPIANFRDSVSPAYGDKNSSDYPGFGLIDIFHDSLPSVNDWFDDDWIWGASSRELAQGYGASYRGRFFDETLHLWAGLRHEAFESWAEGTLGVGQGNGVLLRTNKNNGTTPMYGASYRIQKGVNLYASYSESFKPLSKVAQGKNRDPDNLADPNAFLPITTLTNPAGLGYEAGVKVELFEQLLVGTLAVFHIEKEGEVYRDGAQESYLQTIYDDWNLTHPADQLRVGNIYRNSGLETTEGVELESLLTLRPNWQINLAFAYTWKKEQSEFDPERLYGNKTMPPGTSTGPYPHPSLFVWDDIYGGYRPKSEDEKKADSVEEIYPEKLYRELPGVPDFTFGIWSRYSFKEGVLKGGRFGLGYKWESASNVSDSKDRPWENPATHFVDAMVGYEMPLGRGTLDLALNLTNLLDKRYTRSSFGILTPRNIQFTVEYKF